MVYYDRLPAGTEERWPEIAFVPRAPSFIASCNDVRFLYYAATLREKNIREDVVAATDMFDVTVVGDPAKELGDYPLGFGLQGETIGNNVAVRNKLLECYAKNDVNRMNDRPIVAAGTMVGRFKEFRELIHRLARSITIQVANGIWNSNMACLQKVLNGMYPDLSQVKLGLDCFVHEWTGMRSENYI